MTKYSLEPFLWICGQKCLKAWYYCRLDHCLCINLSRTNHTLDFRKPEKKHIKDNNCSGLPVEMLLLKVIISVPEWLETFQPSYASSKGKWVSSFLKTMPSEIGFPITLTSGVFVKKCNKQTNHELQNNPDSSCISFCKSSRKRQFKTSQDEWGILAWFHWSLWEFSLMSSTHLPMLVWKGRFAFYK